MNSFATRTQRYQLANGITLLVLENHANPTVSISGSIRAGAYFNPPEKHGLSSLTASMLNKGTARRSKLEIAEALESAAARVGLSGNTFTATISGQSLSRDLPLVINTLAEELREPTFPADELDKLRQRTIAHIREDEEETRHRAFDRLSQLVFAADSPFHRPSADALIAAIEAVTPDDLRGFHAARYGAASLILAVAGDVEAERVRELVERAFGDGTWRGAPKPEITLAATPRQAAPLRETVAMQDKANCDVVIGHASGLRRAHADYLAAIVGNRALGQSTLSSRLGLKVRDEMGLTYGINSSFAEVGLGDGPFIIGVTVASQNIDLAIDTTLGIVNDFIADGITDDELRDEQSALVGSFKIGLATNAGMASQLVTTEVFALGVGYLDEYPGIVAALTKDEVDAAIRKYLHPEVATTVIAGTF